MSHDEFSKFDEILKICFGFLGQAQSGIGYRATKNLKTSLQTSILRRFSLVVDSFDRIQSPLEGGFVKYPENAQNVKITKKFVKLQKFL